MPAGEPHRTAREAMGSACRGLLRFAAPAACLAITLYACGQPPDAQPVGRATELPTAQPTATEITASESMAAPDESLKPSTPRPASPTATATARPTATPSGGARLSELTITVAEIPPDIPRYDRDEWLHWTDEDDDCQNTRHEVLVSESRGGVTYRDARQCQVVSGLWLDPLSGETATLASELQIDHLVALYDAHRSGGWAWSPQRKREFANDLDDPGHLNATLASINQAKSASGPHRWRPPNRSHWCDYATRWIRIKSRWQLTAVREEANALSEMLETCTIPPRLIIKEVDPSSRPVRAAPTPTDRQRSYKSCEEAEMAGEERKRGSKGSARGFPKSMVPGAMDGDGDGMVCER